MEHNLAENIRKYRKERNMTQEDLAEKLHLTLGTISKWERGSSEPELSYLMQLAQIFHVSLDALLGFSIQSNNVEVLVEKIQKFMNAREFEKAKKECESALLIYPNHFKVVTQVAYTYELIGMVTKEKESLQKAIQYFMHSIDLFSQNVDPKISLTELQNDVAGCYLALNETQKGIELLKANNVCGINDADIAINLIVMLKQDKEGFQYAQKAFANHAAKMINVLIALMAYYVNEKKPREGIQTVEKAIKYLKLFKKDQKETAFVDKYIAGMMLFSAVCHELEGDWDRAKIDIRKAIDLAAAFDKAPCFNARNFAFIDDIGETMVYDSLGLTAKQGLISMMEEYHLMDSTSDRFHRYFRDEMGQEG